MLQGPPGRNQFIAHRQSFNKDNICEYKYMDSSRFLLRKEELRFSIDFVNVKRILPNFNCHDLLPEIFDNDSVQ